MYMLVQEAHAKETTELTAKQQLDMTQARAAIADQENIASDLEKRMGCLQLEHEESMLKHAKEQETFLEQAEDAKKAAVKVHHHGSSSFV